jgi:hypothetical protein
VNVVVGRAHSSLLVVVKGCVWSLCVYGVTVHRGEQQGGRVHTSEGLARVVRDTWRRYAVGHPSGCACVYSYHLLHGWRSIYLKAGGARRSDEVEFSMVL